MGLLGGLFSPKDRPAGPPAPVVDETFGDPDAVALRTALAERNWPAARSILNRDRTGDEYRFLLDQGAGVKGNENWLASLMRKEPDDSLIRVLHGARMVKWAWEARGGGWARHVPARAVKTFLERLVLAERSLQDAVRHDPTDTAAWTAMIRVAMGGSFSMEAKRQRFQWAVAPDPTNFHAHRAMLLCLCQKWGGSHAAMHDFARTAARQAAPGSRLGGLVAMAHAEHWLLSGKYRADYYRPPAVRDELVQAADRSVRHPDYVRAPDWPVEFNYLVHGLSMARAQDVARELFDAIGDRVTDFPWMWMRGNDPGAAYAQRRAIR